MAMDSQAKGLQIYWKERMSNTERLEWIDIVKGFAIICMLISHAIPGYTNSIKNWITALNMPIFFVVSGYLKERTEKKHLISDLRPYLKNRFFTLGIPYIVFCLSYTMFMLLLSLYSSGWSPETIRQLKNHLKNTFFFFGLQSMWFIPVYFYSVMIYDFFICESGIKTKAVTILIAATILLKGHSLFELNSVSRIIGKIVEALVFLQIGAFLYRFQNRVDAGFAIVCFVFFSFLGIWNGFVSMNFEFGKNPVLFFINASVLSVAICYLFKIISHLCPLSVRSFLALYGQYSIAILVTNNIIIEIIRLLDYKLTGDFFLVHGNSGNLLFAALLVLLEYLVILAARGKAGILFGKGKQK